MEKRKSEGKSKKRYSKPELTRHEKLTMVTGGNPSSLGGLGCTRS